MEKRADYLAPVRDVADEIATLNTWITVPEIAIEIGRSASTVRGLLSAGIIPCRRVGSRYYIRKSEFLAWRRGDESTPAKATDLESLVAAVQAVLDGRVRVVVTFEPVGPARR